MVVSNDSDLSEPVRVVREELGRPIGVVNPHPARRRSRDLQPTFFRQLRSSVLGGCQLPPVLTDERGEFRKPATW